MAARTLDIYQINNKRYVSPRAAANYLDIADDVLQNDIYVGKLKADFVASRQERVRLHPMVYAPSPMCLARDTLRLSSLVPAVASKFLPMVHCAVRFW